MPQSDMIMHFSVVSAIHLDNNKLSFVRTVSTIYPAIPKPSAVFKQLSGQGR